MLAPCCPLAMSQMSLVKGATMGSRACLAGEIAPMRHPPGSLFLLLTRVLSSMQVQVSWLVHPLKDDLLPTVQDWPHHVLFLRFLFLPQVLLPRAMTDLVIRTMMINQSARQFPTPVLLLHVTIK